jgi:hypothetical protein
MVFSNASFWVFFSYIAAPPPYNPYAAYPVPPVPMTSPSPVPPTAYAPVQVIIFDLLHNLSVVVLSLSWTVNLFLTESFKA